ncbi:hypothetical protein DAEQUDRAFT_720101 [Daedalea quercina L-15889]|uniref:Uncharacterized protein n=1 Tax=Daedalea quercina L-15889 TaxID=1314783 RepID=A0A165UHJ6_9APHY|nr:hypothetical protein DAEQUDRAFT_720101 [Daedalea quercina L-15889]
MDELIQHCLRELSYDGDLGSNDVRLRESIELFYAHRDLTGQKIDDAYCAFVWGILVQQPNVRVGVVPEGTGAEVYIAPQNSAKRKAKAKGQEIADSAPTILHVVPDAASRPLEELKQDYGDSLRVAVDSDTIFKALTGSHIRDSKLSPMVYTALQLISRGREAGISSVDLAKKSGYDPKTCHYLVNQLLSLNLVVKRGKTAGVSTSTVVHRDLFRRNATWQSIVDEENRAREAQKRKVNDEESDAGDEEDSSEFSLGSTEQFDPIDERHLSSIDLIRGRIVTLLRNSPHGLHAANNLLPKIGFSNPNKSNRRYFITRCLHEYIKEGLIEKVRVPGKNGRLVTCIHLSEHNASGSQPELIVQPEELVEVEPSREETLAMNLTLHKQIINLLDQAGERGMTLGDLCGELNDFDRRTVELLLERLHSNPPPRHLADLGIAHVFENYGRERRYRYWTVAHYRTMAAREGFTEHSYPDVDLDATGGFSSVAKTQFYDDDDALNAYVDGLRQGPVPKTPSSSKGKKQYKNPILPDGTVKRGRPRKSTVVSGANSETATRPKGGRGRKRKRGDNLVDEADADVTGEPASKRKRGRPPKRQQPEPTESSAARLDESGVLAAGLAPESQPSQGTQGHIAKPKHGLRPKRKGPDALAAEADPPTQIDTPMRTPPTPKRRGRPRKQPLLDISAGAVATPERAVGDAEVPTPAREERPLDGSLQDDQPHSILDLRAVTDTVMVNAGQLSDSVGSPNSVQTPLEVNALADPSVGSNAVSPTISGAESIARPVGNVPLRRERNHSNATELLVGLPNDMRQRGSTPVVEPANVALAPSGASTALCGGEQLAGSLTSTTLRIPPDVMQGYPQIPIDPALLAESGITNMDSGLVKDSAYTVNAVPKRVLSDTAVQAPPAKRMKSLEGPDDTSRSAYSKTRLIQARRERELLRVVKDAGGIINVSSKDFYDAHAALVGTMSAAGEATSTRIGSRMDKRTVEATLKDLDARGKIKLLTTSIRISTGATRPVRIVYLPEIPDGELQTFLGNINIQQFPPAAPIKTLDEPVLFGGANLKRLVARSPCVVQEGVTVISSNDPQANRDPLQHAIVNDKNTIAQSHGFITGKLARARTLHLWMVDFLQSGTTSAHVLSVRERVISFSLLLNDLPISKYCAFVSSQVQNEELLQLLRSPGGPLTPVGEVSSTIRDSLRIGRWRSRGRLLDILEVLCRLKVVDLLTPSSNAIPAVILDPTPLHPSMFDVAPVETWSPLTAPGYLRLNISAPLHLWAVSEDSPPFWKDILVYPVSHCSEYWHQLRAAVLDRDAAKQIPAADLGEPLTRVGEFGRVLRRPSAWSDDYVLSPNQETYLKRHMDLGSGESPLQDGNPDRLESLCAAVSAPRRAVVRFYENLRGKVRREKEKMEKKAERRAQEAKVREAQSKATMIQRAAEAKAQREKDWEDMVAKVHPDPLTDSAASRIRRLRTRFLQGSRTDPEKWEGEISQAIQESIFAAKQVLNSARAPLARPATAPTVPSLVVAAAPEKSVREIIASQGPRLAPRQPARKSKKTKDAKDGDTPSVPARRQRFQWNRDYDELARDASAIIRARCREHHRIDLAALIQAFPAVPINSVRQRIVHLREAPGADTYLQRLEDKWYDVWQQHRGTDALPDDDPESRSNFDMIAHLEFLRKHVDKNALRVGFMELSHDADFALPRDVYRLYSLWEVQEKPAVAPLFDFVWSGSAEEGREKQLAQHAFAADIQDIPPVVEYSSDSMYVADSAMKMVLSTPNELYDVRAATDLLQSIGEDPVKVATEAMLARGVLSKVVRDPSKSRPGRTLKISDSNQNAMSGSIPQDVFQDAAALEDVLGQDDDQDAWREWSLLSSDGDMAALLDLVSSNKVEFKVDTSNPQTRRPGFDWNSKKADDDDIETGIMVRIPSQTENATVASVVEQGVGISDTEATPMQQSVIDTPIDPALSEGALMPDSSYGDQHGKTWDGGTAFCAQSTHGLVDCQACLQAAKAALLLTVANEEAGIMNRVLDELQDAAAAGLEKTHVMRIVQDGQCSSVLEILGKITNSKIPLAYWTGYTSVVLVATEYIRPWTVCISGVDGTAIVHPRRWLDVSGRKIDGVWVAALRAVTGVIVFRPGVTQAEIRWRLRSVYNRQEVNDALRYLSEHDHIVRRLGTDIGQGANVGMPDGNEEHYVFWFSSGESHWYDL